MRFGEFDIVIITFWVETSRFSGSVYPKSANPLKFPSRVPVLPVLKIDFSRSFYPFCKSNLESRMASQIHSITPFEIRMRNIMGYLLLVRDAVDKGSEYHRPNEIPGDETCEGLEETTLRPALTNANDQPQKKTRTATDSETYVFTRDTKKWSEKHNYIDSDIESNASESSRVSRSSTVFTIPPTTAVASVPQHVPTFEELSRIVLEIGPRVTWEYLKIIIKNSTLVCSKSQRHDLKRMSLRRCPAQSQARRMHEYDASQRCVSCGTQLCQVSQLSLEGVIVKYHCHFISDSIHLDETCQDKN